MSWLTTNRKFLEGNDEATVATGRDEAESPGAKTAVYFPLFIVLAALSCYVKLLAEDGGLFAIYE